MIPLVVNLDGDNAWPDLRDKLDAIIHLGNDTPAIRVAVLKEGMASGRPSVALRFELPDGTTVIAETSARLFVSAGRMISARYPQLFDGD